MLTLNRKPFSFWFDCLAEALIVYACIPNRLFSEVRYCMDPSWQYSINTAIHKHYAFGNDFVFTYGPLGFLSTGNPLFLADRGFGIIVYKAVLFGSLVAIGLYALRSATSIWQKMAVVMIFGLAGRLYAYESSVYYLVIFLALLFLHQKKTQDVFLYIALAFSGINFFIKLNTALVLPVLFATYTVALCFQQKLSWLKLFTMAISAILLVWIIALFTHTNPLSYLSNGFEITSHFAEAQTYRVGVRSVTFICALGILLGFAFILTGSLKNNEENPFKWINSLLAAGCLFILFKQGFVRGSYNHQISFFGSSLLLLLVFFALVNGREFTFLQNVTGLGIILIGLVAIIKIGIYGFGFSPVKDLYTANDNRIAFLPDRIKKTIGNASIDLLPFETMHLFYNGLNYAPRPIPQGYQAYTGKLDSLNAGYYLNNKAPEFVLFANGSIDHHHPFWDEYQTKLAIRANYEIRDSILLPDRPGLTPTLYWLLKKKEAIKSISKNIAGRPWQQSISDTIDCRLFSKDALLKIKIQPNAGGQLVKVFFQPSILSCHIQYANGMVSRYDAITPILAGGIPVGCKLESNEDISSFLRNQPPDPTTRIVKIWFSGNTSLFKKLIQLQLVDAV